MVQHLDNLDEKTTQILVAELSAEGKEVAQVILGGTGTSEANTMAEGFHE